MLKIDSFLQRCEIEVNKDSNPFLLSYKITGDLAATKKKTNNASNMVNYIELCTQRQYWGTHRE
jgi:hypothetical protein